MEERRCNNTVMSRKISGPLLRKSQRLSLGDNADALLMSFGNEPASEGLCGGLREVDISRPQASGGGSAGWRSWLLRL